MAKRNKRSKPGRTPRTAAYVDPATPQTRKKHCKGTIEALLDSGRIGGIEQRAATEIEQIYTVLCGRLFARSGAIAERLDKSSGDFPEWFLGAYHGRYLPWAKKHSRGVNTHKDNTLEIVYAIVIDGKSGRWVDGEFNFRSGVGLEILIDGLRDYSAMAGWADRNTIREWESNAARFSRVRRMPA